MLKPFKYTVQNEKVITSKQFRIEQDDSQNDDSFFRGGDMSSQNNMRSEQNLKSEKSF